MCTKVSIHTANSVGVISGVVAGFLTVILTLIVVVYALCFFKIHGHKKAILGNVLLCHVVMWSYYV